MTRATILVLFLFSLLYLSCTELKGVAQMGITGALMNGSISGQVQDLEGQTAIPATTIEVQGTPFKVLSDSQGGFHIRYVPPGRYRLLVSKLGYTSVEPVTVLVVQNTTTRIDIMMKPAHPVATLRQGKRSVCSNCGKQP